MAAQDEFWAMARALETMESFLAWLPKITEQKVMMKKKRRPGHPHTIDLHQCMVSVFEDLDDIRETTNFILNNCGDHHHPSLKHRAANLKLGLLHVCDFVLSEMTADPLFHCMLQRMKNVTYSYNINSGGEDVCVICQDEFGKSVVGLDVQQTECGHRFHGRCIFKWFKSGHRTCPMCRSTLLHVKENI